MALRGHDEVYLAFLMNKFVGPLPSPITRSDFYLLKLCGFDPGELPDPLSLGDALLKEFVESDEPVDPGVSYEPIGVSGMFAASLYCSHGVVQQPIVHTDGILAATPIGISGMFAASLYCSHSAVLGPCICDY